MHFRALDNLIHNIRHKITVQLQMKTEKIRRIQLNVDGHVFIIITDDTFKYI